MTPKLKKYCNDNMQSLPIENLLATTHKDYMY